MLLDLKQLFIVPKKLADKYLWLEDRCIEYLKQLDNVVI
jgi:hypothetical protein